LIADQFPLIKQFKQLAIQQNFVLLDFLDKTAPVYEDTEKTYTEIRTRITNTLLILKLSRKRLQRLGIKKK